MTMLPRGEGSGEAKYLQWVLQHGWQAVLNTAQDRFGLVWRDSEQSRVTSERNQYES